GPSPGIVDHEVVEGGTGKHTAIVLGAGGADAVFAGFDIGKEQIRPVGAPINAGEYGVVIRVNYIPSDVQVIFFPEAAARLIEFLGFHLQAVANRLNVPEQAGWSSLFAGCGETWKEIAGKNAIVAVSTRQSVNVNPPLLLNNFCSF